MLNSEFEEVSSKYGSILSICVHLNRVENGNGGTTDAHTKFKPIRGSYFDLKLFISGNN